MTAKYGLTLTAEELKFIQKLIKDGWYGQRVDYKMMRDLLEKINNELDSAEGDIINETKGMC